MWLPHHVASNFFGWCRLYKTFKSNFHLPYPLCVIIQVPSVSQRILLCIPRPSTFLSSITSYVNKCLNKRWNWSMFPPKNKLLIYLLNLFPGKHSNISDKSWELSLPLRRSDLLKFKILNWIRGFHKGQSRIYRKLRMGFCWHNFLGRHFQNSCSGVGYLWWCSSSHISISSLIFF